MAATTPSPTASRTPTPTRTAGFTLLEILLTLGILGVLSTAGYLLMPRDGLQLREASRILSSDLTRARSEAVRLNANVAIDMESGTSCGTYCIFVDTNRDGTPDANFDLDPGTPDEVPPRLVRRDFDETFPLVDLTSATSAGITTERVWFDVRGLPRTSTGGMFAEPVVIELETERGLHQVVLEPQGRIRVVVP